MKRTIIKLFFVFKMEEPKEGTLDIAEIKKMMIGKAIIKVVTHSNIICSQVI